MAAGQGGEGHVKPVIGCWLVGIDDDVVALADAEEEVVARDGLDGHHVGCDDLEGVADETDGEGVLEGGVDQSKEMFLSLGEGLAGVGAPGSVGVDVAAV